MGTLVATNPVLHFRDVGLGDVATVGGKGASLGELLRAGIRVPTGFAVTTAAFRQTVEHLTVDGEKLEKRVLAVPKEIDEEIARLKLESLGVAIDSLTPEQEEYLSSWATGLRS